MSPQADVRKELHRGDTELASGTGPLWFSNGASWGPEKTLSSQTCIILAPTEQWGEILTMTNSGSVLRIMAHWNPQDTGEKTSSPVGTEQKH